MNRKQRWTIITAITVLAALVLLSSCASEPPPPQRQQTAPAPEPAAQPEQPEQAPTEAEPPLPAETAAKPKPAAKADVDAGKTIYAKKCAACHGERGEGKAAMAKMLKVELRPLGSAAVQAKSDEELSRDISQGTGKMKAVTGLSDADLANLVAFLRTLK